jgi:hypothetical protein
VRDASWSEDFRRSCELLEEGERVAQATGEVAATEPELVAVGTPVEVRSRFVGSWSRGFEVADHRGGRYRIKRLSDGSILPDEFDPSEIRPERRRHDFWWY